MSEPDNDDGKKEAVKTYIEQTKLLVTLASAFVIAPAAFVGVFKDSSAVGLRSSQLRLLIVAEVLFIVSVLAGYVVLATIAGYQHLSRYDVHRPATRWSSIIQILAYVIGLGVFISLTVGLVSSSSSVLTR